MTSRPPRAGVRRPPKPRLRPPTVAPAPDPSPTPAPSTKRLRTSSPTTVIVEEATQVLGKSPPCDELGILAAEFAARLDSTSFRDLVQSVRGRSDLHADVGSVPHAAAPLLDRMRRLGVPVPLSTPPLPDLVRAVAIAYGSHASCDLNPAFLRAEMADFVRKIFWIVLPYEVVRDMPDLRLSPAGLVPQREHQDRLIIDYT